MKRKILIFIAGLVTVLFISGCIESESDVQFTRRLFNALCKGNQGVQNLIDWENLQAMGLEVGKSYSSIISEKERADYRKVFFYNLTYAFKAAGGKTSGFTNWRVQNRVGNNTVVAADSTLGKAILLTLVNKEGKRKLTAIEWQQ